MLFLTEKMKIQKPQIDFLWFLCYNRDMGVAPSICNTNAKLAINAEDLYERHNRSLR